MRAIRSTLASIREFRRAYVVLNLVYYGLVVCAMIYVSFNPSLQQMLLEAVGTAFTEGPLSAVGGAYVGGQVWLAMALTFVVNLVVMSCPKLHTLALGGPRWPSVGQPSLGRPAGIPRSCF